MTGYSSSKKTTQPGDAAKASQGAQDASGTLGLASLQDTVGNSGILGSILGLAGGLFGGSESEAPTAQAPAQPVDLSREDYQELLDQSTPPLAEMQETGSFVPPPAPPADYEVGLGTPEAEAYRDAIREWNKSESGQAISQAVQSYGGAVASQLGTEHPDRAGELGEALEVLFANNLQHVGDQPGRGDFMKWDRVGAEGGVEWADIVSTGGMVDCEGYQFVGQEFLQAAGVDHKNITSLTAKREANTMSGFGEDQHAMLEAQIDGKTLVISNANTAVFEDQPTTEDLAAHATQTAAGTYSAVHGR